VNCTAAFPVVSSVGPQKETTPVTQCGGTTKKGDRCKRDAREGSPFCAIHQDQEVRERAQHATEEWDKDALIKAAIGFGLVAAIFLFRFRR
jgi:hypothetical protein